MSVSNRGKPVASQKATAGGKPGAGKPGKPRGRRRGRRVTPVSPAKGRNWVPIATFASVLVVAVSIIGYGAWAVYQNGLTWAERAERIEGLVNWRQKAAKALTSDHKTGVVDYSALPMKPPVGGNHNANWQRCQGDVYDAPIAVEHVLHSMEHGSVWITYRPDLPKDQIESLAKRIRGTEYRLMSPYEGQDAPISLQAWGYQLKVDTASDARIDPFLVTLTGQAGLEKGATCTSGAMITETGTTPRDLAPPQQQPGAGMPGGQPGAGQPGAGQPGAGQPVQPVP